MADKSTSNVAAICARTGAWGRPAVTWDNAELIVDSLTDATEGHKEECPCAGGGPLEGMVAVHGAILETLAGGTTSRHDKMERTPVNQAKGSLRGLAPSLGDAGLADKVNATAK